MYISSDDFKENTLQQHDSSPYKIHCFFQAYQNQFPGGDRFSISVSADGVLCFYIADATGHGDYASETWRHCTVEFDTIWKGFLHKNSTLSNLQNLSSQVNNLLYRKKDSCNSQLCIAFGILRHNHLWFSNHGYGTHALVQSHGRAVKLSEPLFGLKLGWVDEKTRTASPRGNHKVQVEHTTRLILITDSFLEDDFKHPQKTLKDIEKMNERSLSLEFKEVIPFLLDNYTHDKDDTSVIVIEIDPL